MHTQGGVQPVPIDDGPSVLIHGGAWAIPDEECPAHHDGLEQAVYKARDMLQKGASALEVVSETVAGMELHGAFDAGKGAVLTRAGTVELDAGIMDGATMRVGAVANVKRLLNPVLAARLILRHGKGDFRMLIAEQAEAFAAEHGQKLVPNEQLISDRERRRFEQLRAAAAYHTSHPFQDRGPRGTVGCVARDRQGRLAAATSTGGTPFRRPGRVGDSPLCGSGFYANQEGAASATGWGEAIMTVLLGYRGLSNLSRLPVAEAAQEALRFMFDNVKDEEGSGATGGLLLMAADGSGAWSYSTPRMARAGWRHGGEAWWVVER